MQASIRDATFDVNGTKVDANFDVIGRALPTGLSTGVNIYTPCFHDELR